MKFAEIVKEIARREGKKSQVTIGNIREVLSHVCDIVWEDNSTETLMTILKNGERRARRKANQ